MGKEKHLKKGKYQEYHQSVKQFGSRSGPTFWVQTVCIGYQQTTLVSTKELRTFRGFEAEMQKLFFTNLFLSVY